MRRGIMLACATLLTACATTGQRPVSGQVSPLELGAALGAAIHRDSVVVTLWQRERRMSATVPDTIAVRDPAAADQLARLTATWLWTHFGEKAGLQEVWVFIASAPPRADGFATEVHGIIRTFRREELQQH